MANLTFVVTESIEKSNNTNTTAYIGNSDMYANLTQPPLLETNFVLAVAYCTVTGIVIIVGTVGNIIVLVMTIVKKTANNMGRLFTINLALADLCVAAVAEPMCILGVILGEAWFNKHWFLCEAVSMLCVTACMCSYLSLVLLVVNRYVYVCRYKSYFLIFGPRRCIAACAACWILGLIIDTTNFWVSDHIFDQKIHKCTWSRTKSFSFTLVVVISMVVPFIPIVLTFVLVFRKIIRCKQNVCSLNGDSHLSSRKALTETLRSVRTLFLCFLADMICWMPYILLIIVDFSDTATTEVYLFITLLAHAHACGNFIMYMISNKTFRNSVMKMFLKSKDNTMEARVRQLPVTKVK